jgi:hypothetical protein
VNSEAARQLACAGQVFAGLEVARQDGKLHLGDKLAIGWGPRFQGKTRASRILAETTTSVILPPI